MKRGSPRGCRIALGCALIVVVAIALFFFYTGRVIDRNNAVLVNNLRQPSGVSGAVGLYPKNPAPVDGSELVDVRRPPSQSVLYPGIKMRDTLDEVRTALKAKGIQFAYNHNFFNGQDSIEYYIRGKILGMPKEEEFYYSFFFYNSRLYTSNIGPDRLTREQAMSYCTEWRSKVADIMKVPPRENDSGGTTDWEWHDSRASIMVLCKESAHAGVWQASIVFIQLR